MSFPPLRSSRDSTPANETSLETSASGRSRQSAWGLSAPISRRDLNSLDTTFTTSTTPSIVSRQHNPTTINNLNSSAGGSASSARESFSRISNRNTTSISASSSPFGGFQIGGPLQQLSSSQLLASRSSTNTPSNQSNQASSAAASTSAGGAGGSGGGGTIRTSNNTSASSITSPISSTLDRNPFGSGSNSSNQSSVLKITLTQLSLLFSPLSEAQGKAKWETQVEAIRKFVREHGPQASQAYFRKLLSSSPQFSTSNKSRSAESSGIYTLLVEEVTNSSQNFDKARQIANAVDASDDNQVKELDLQGFLNQFKLDSIGKTIVASAFAQTSRPELRTKATSILAATFPALLQALATPTNQERDTTPDVLATAILQVLLDLPEAARDGSEKAKINQALISRYSKLEKPIPHAVISAMALSELFGTSSELAQEYIRMSSNSTVSNDATKELLRRIGRVNIHNKEVAIAIMAMVLHFQPEVATSNLNTFIQIIRDHYSNVIEWDSVAKNFDQEFFVLDKMQFLVLYKALLPLAQDGKLDIEILWSSEKRSIPAQLAAAVSFVSLDSDELDATTIPNLQTAFDPQEAADGSDEVRTMAEEARHDTMISVKAVEAIVNALWDPYNSTLLSGQDTQNARAIIIAKMPLFVCSAAGIPASKWSSSLQTFIERTVQQCLTKEQKHYEFILHILWKQDKNWLHTRLVQFHVEDPIKLPVLLEHAQEHGWLRELCTTVTGLGIDLAAMAHKKGYIDIQEWAADKLAQSPAEFTSALARFLVIKTQDESRTRHHEQPAPRTVSLAIKTVWAILEILEEHVSIGRDELNALERTCISAYPRLCNYGEGFDHVIDQNGLETNALSPIADAQMQEQYKKMYSGEMDVKTIIERLRDCKTSEDGEKQDLFACMIHGLFDEYTCFNDYPIGPLQKTAVLFGGVISYRLLNNIALNVALDMVLESVRAYSPEASMYKFGVQALKPFHGRLAEWPSFCQKILQIHSLQGKEVYARAQEVVQNQGTNGTTPDDEGIDDIDARLRGGEDFVDNDSLVPQFSSINVDAIPHGHHFEDPVEDVGDKILFFLNNVSSENLQTRIKDLIDVLEPKHYLWFARLIVDERAKSQPNYQELYLSILDELNDGLLWSGILRESYACIRKVINADATMKVQTERTNLKNLATWLGSLTIARDKPIKHKNIAFKELLLEGWETSRLLLVIPFTCEVLNQGTRSILFKPPNPWVMEIIGLLLELYDLPELKIQHRFAIEILLSNFGLPRKGDGMERGNDLKKRQQMFDTAPEAIISDDLDMFNDLGLGGLSKIPRQHFTPPPLPDLDDRLVLPPGTSMMGSQALRNLVHNAVRKSIEEIIGPVVERSITIATISTKSLVQKDFSQESDELAVRQAFENMVKCLAGSLASVTSKEPLRMSMNTYIRNAAGDLPEQALPEGSILMCVNDNLDMACRIIQKQAEDRALLEIEPAIEAEVALRREHKLKYPNEPYRDANTSHWATYIPEPYKQVSGGLNQQQIDIYQQFAQQARGAVMGNGSMDGNKQLPDVLQEFNIPAMPNLTTPAEQPALPHQAQSAQQQARLIPPSIASTRPPSQVNGYMDPTTILNHIRECLRDVLQACRSSTYATLREVTSDSAIHQGLDRALDLFASLTSDIEAVAEQVIRDVCTALFIEGEVPLLDAQVLAAIIVAILRSMPEAYSIRLICYVKMVVEDHVQTRADVTVVSALLEHGLLEYGKIDSFLESNIQQGSLEAQRCLAGLLDILLFVPDPIIDRPRFARCLAAIGELANRQPDNTLARSIVDKLSEHDNSVLAALDDKERESYQMQHLYEQWYLTYTYTDGKEEFLIPLFSQIRDTLTAQDAMIKFVRHCVERAVQEFNDMEKMAHQNGDSSMVPNDYVRLDSVASLIVLVSKAQSGTTQTKPETFKSLLLVVALILHHSQWRTDIFNGRPFLRLFSTVLYDWHSQFRGLADAQLDSDMVLAIAQVLSILQPNQYPGFLFQWIALATHQVFLPAILRTGWQAGHAAFARILRTLLTYVTSVVHPTQTAGPSRILYRSATKLLVLLHHDFPEFLSDYHYEICNTIPSDFPLLRNIILSATPASILDKPDPFTPGLKIDRLEEIKQAPNTAADTGKILQEADVKNLIDAALESANSKGNQFNELVSVLSGDEDFDKVKGTALLHAVVIYIAQKATAPSSPGASPSFSMDGPYSTLVVRITKALGLVPRFFFLSSIADQLRFPNSHTWFYSSTLLHLFGKEGEVEANEDIRHTITRIMLERAVLHRPHPWGTIVLLLELLKNNTYGFWNQPLVKGNAEVRDLCERLLSARPDSQYNMEPGMSMRNHI